MGMSCGLHVMGPARPARDHRAYPKTRPRSGPWPFFGNPNALRTLEDSGKVEPAPDPGDRRRNESRSGPWSFLAKASALRTLKSKIFLRGDFYVDAQKQRRYRSDIEANNPRSTREKNDVERQDCCRTNKAISGQSENCWRGPRRHMGADARRRSSAAALGGSDA